MGKIDEVDVLFAIETINRDVRKIETYLNGIKAKTKFLYTHIKYNQKTLKKD